MIQLDVQGYCQQCRDFESSVTKDVLYSNGDAFECVFTVRCKNANRCEALVRYLKNHKEEEN